MSTAEPQHLRIPFIPISLNEWGNMHHMARAKAKKNFTQAMRLCLRSQKPRFVTGRVDIHIRFVWPDLHGRDVDNRAKWVLDALVGLAITDDNWKVIRTLTLSGACDRNCQERTEITITPIADEEVATCLDHWV